MARKKPLVVRILGALFSGQPSRKLGPKRAPAPRRAAAPKAPKAPRPGPGPATAKIKASRGRQRKIPAIYSDRYLKEVLAGKHGAEALRKVLSGARTAKKNPAHLRDLARKQSATFHGSGFADVVELSPTEQRQHGMPRWVVPIGRQEAVEYVPPSGSARAGAIWRHKAGDRGRGKSEARGRALLVADPRNGRTAMIGGPQKFDPRRGLVG